MHAQLSPFVRHWHVPQSSPRLLVYITSNVAILDIAMDDPPPPPLVRTHRLRGQALRDFLKSLEKLKDDKDEPER